MGTRHWKWRLADLAILGALILIINPETRVLLILVNTLSLELVLFLCMIQLRSFIPIMAVALRALAKWSCVSSYSTLRGVLRLLGALLPSGPPSALSMFLYVLSKTLWCPLSQSKAPA